MLGLGNSITKQYNWSPRSLGTKFIHWYKFNTGITTKSISDTPGFVTAWEDQIADNHLAPTVDDDANTPWTNVDDAATNNWTNVDDSATNTWQDAA